MQNNDKQLIEQFIGKEAIYSESQTFYLVKITKIAADSNGFNATAQIIGDKRAFFGDEDLEYVNETEKFSEINFGGDWSIVSGLHGNMIFIAYVGVRINLNTIAVEAFKREVPSYKELWYS